MRRMRWGLIAIVAAGWLSAGPAAAGAAVLAPPGHAGANQYFETIPTSSGNAAPPGSVHGSGSQHGASHSLAGFGQGASTDAKLAGLGSTGQAAAALAAATAPSPAPGSARAGVGSGGPSGGASSGGENSAGGNSSGGSVAGGIAQALTGSDAGGLGLALPLLLVTGLLVVVGLALTRLTRRAGSTPPGS